MAFSVASTSAVAPRRAVARAAAPQKAAQQPVGRREAAQLAAAALGLALGARPANALPKKAQIGDASNGDKYGQLKAWDPLSPREKVKSGREAALAKARALRAEKQA